MLCKVAYTNPINGGHRPLCHLVMADIVVQFVYEGPKLGPKQPRGGGYGKGVPPPIVRREIFENVCMKTTFSCTLLPLLGVVYVVA